NSLKFKNLIHSASVTNSAMKETSDLREKWGDGSSPSEAHGGGVGGSWLGWRGTGAVTDYILIIKSHGRSRGSIY
ncbi:MAG: hypothetical protein OEV50_07080, partial [Candidatus Aminicenantes bacterium]|nr:hypothetical protein [Candidatus Aminicenantes bacterium]